MASDLSLENVSVAAGRKVLLDAVSMRVAKGQFLALVGPNGAGKTTVLRAALGLTDATGSVILDGSPVRQWKGLERAARAAWLPQHPAVIEPVTALELVCAARLRFHEPRHASESAALAALERAGVAAFAGRAVTTLSGGERQRVAVAALLAQDAPLLLLDEPANHLDPGQQIALYRLLGELWREGRGVLCVTHDVNLLGWLGEPARVRVAGLRDGRVAFESRYDAPELPALLSSLFEIEMRALHVDDRRLLVPAGGAP